MRDKPAAPDLAVAGIAARQHGVVSIGQLMAAGISRDGVTRRVHAGRLHRVHQGVYAVGHAALPSHGRWIAAVLAFGEGAALSHSSAAALWRLLPARGGLIHVTVAGSGGGSRSRRSGIRLHCSTTLTPGRITLRRGIPVTTPARTIADLRGAIPANDLRKAIRQANVLGLDIGEDVEADWTSSELEYQFLRLCRRHTLPQPEVNVEVGPFVVDFLWREQRLIAETDGYRFHRGREAFEEDRARDLQLRLLGYEVVRFTFRHVMDDPAGVAAAVDALLGRR
jgi:very-short-patch-repair endonuclease